MTLAKKNQGGKQMLKLWEKSKVDVFFEDEANEKLVRQGFNNLIGDVSDEELGAFINSINSLHELPAAHAIVSESYRYTI